MIPTARISRFYDAELSPPSPKLARRRDVISSPGRSPAPARRTAFTWRLTADQAQMLDEMTLRLKRELRRGKLDRAEMLNVLVGPTADNPGGVFGPLVARLQVSQMPRRRGLSLASPDWGPVVGRSRRAAPALAQSREDDQGQRQPRFIDLLRRGVFGPVVMTGRLTRRGITVAGARN